MRLIALLSLIALAFFVVDGPSPRTLTSAYDDLSETNRKRWPAVTGGFGWHAENAGAGSASEDADIDLSAAWALAARCHAPVEVAVIDGGFLAERPELAGRWLPGWDYVTGDDDPYSAPGTRFRHGSAVAALIVEVAPGARLLPLRIYDETGTEPGAGHLDEAIRLAADSGAEVINVSAGLPAFRASERALARFDEAIRYAVARGSFIAIAAGNDGQPNTRGDDFASYPAAYAPQIAGAVAVAASDAADRLWAGSNTGAELAAPGVGIVSVGPGADERELWTGTSMAAPLVAGAAALVLACRPDLSPAEVEALLRASADPLHGPEAQGAGGRLNAAGALTLALKAPRRVRISD